MYITIEIDSIEINIDKIIIKYTDASYIKDENNYDILDSKSNRIPSD